MPLNLETPSLRSLSLVASVAALAAAGSGHGDAWSISISAPPSRSIAVEGRAFPQNRKTFGAVGLHSPADWDIFRELAYYMPEPTWADEVLTDLWYQSARPPTIPTEYVEPASTLASIAALAFIDRSAAIREAMCLWDSSDPVVPEDTVRRSTDESGPWASPLGHEESGLFVPLVMDPSSRLPLAGGLMVRAGLPDWSPPPSSRVLSMTRQAPLDLIIQWLAMGFAVLVFFVPALCAWTSNHIGRTRTHPLDPGPSKGLLDGLASGVARTPSF